MKKTIQVVLFVFLGVIFFHGSARADMMMPDVVIEVDGQVQVLDLAWDFDVGGNEGLVWCGLATTPGADDPI